MDNNKIDSYAATGDDISYKDLPSLDFFQNYEPTKRNNLFLAALKIYHKTPKNSINHLLNRKVLLEAIVSTLGDTDIFELGIKKAIQKKSKYVQKLYQLFDQNILTSKNELYNPDVRRLFLPDDSSNLQLKNDSIYDFDQNKTYGNYFIEAIDPAHRVSFEL